MSVVPRGVLFATLALLAVTLAFQASGRADVTDENGPGAKIDVAALAQRIDQAVQQRLQAEKVQPSPPADDAEFLRRVSLDITGVIPSADKAAAFLDSQDPNKRAKLIDELLASPQYGRHLADIWQAMLLPRTSDNRRLQTQPMSRWLEEQFNSNNTRVPFHATAADVWPLHDAGFGISFAVDCMSDSTYNRGVSTARKPLVWLHGEIKTPPFSQEARIEAGTLLRRLQEGEILEPPHSRPMPDIGPRCHELRVRERTATGGLSTGWMRRRS